MIKTNKKLTALFAECLVRNITIVKAYSPIKAETTPEKPIEDRFKK